MKEIEAAVEAILFASGSAVTVNSISKAIERDIKETKNIVESLKNKLHETARGITIIEVGDSYQMCTSPKYFSYVKNIFADYKKSELTQPLMETLAIIAYKQPITRSEIEEIRGVSADHAVNKLLEKNLICEVGRANVPGKPIIFGTTDEFLRSFGIKNLSELANK